MRLSKRDESMTFFPLDMAPMELLSSSLKPNVKFKEIQTPLYFKSKSVLYKSQVILMKFLSSPQILASF